MADPQEPVDLDAVLAELKDRVAARRASGEYPEELEARLSEHFAGLMAHRHREPPPENPYLEELVRQLDGRGDFGLHRIAYDSRVPGGESLHRTVGRVVARQNAAVLAQLQHWANLVNTLLKVMAHLFAEPPYHFHEDLWRPVDALLQRMAEIERVEAGGPAALAALADRVAALEARADATPFEPWWPADRWDAALGHDDPRAGEHEALAEHLAGCVPVLAWGVDRLADTLLARGDEATGIAGADPVPALRDLDPRSLGGLALGAAVERLSPQRVVDVVALAADRLREGGRLVVAARNPGSLYAHAHALAVDPGAVRPLHPAYLSFLCTEAGFDDVTVAWRGEVAGDAALQPVGDEVHDANVRRLNDLLFAPQGYVVVATR